MGGRKRVTECSNLLARKGLTIAFAESATAGMLACTFSRTPDSGKILKGGIVCYDACLKQDLLKVPKDMIDRYSPESLEVTLHITRNLSHLIPADIYIGVTGLTKPGGSEDEEKPVGTMFTCIKTKKWEILDRSEFKGSEEDIIEHTIENLCTILLSKLNDA